MDLEAEKRRLRRSLGARRRKVSAEDAASAAEAIRVALFAAFAFGPGRRVGLYAALPDEVPTRALFDALVGAGVDCLLPRVADDDRLVFAAVADWAELRAGAFGVLAPPDSAPAASLDGAELVLVPGVAFDRRGVRLGRGGGHYDRSFPTSGGPDLRLCGVAYELQIAESIPCASHDRAMDAIVTEHGFRWTRGEHR